MSRLSTLLVAGVMLLGAGCSQREASNDQSETVADAAPSATATAPVADVRQLAECAAKMEAISRLYRAIASQSSGDEATQMNFMADQRGRAGFDLRMRAEDSERASPGTSGTAPGSAGSQVPRIISETEAALEAQRGRVPFDEFAIWLGREADGCAPFVSPGT